MSRRLEISGRSRDQVEAVANLAGTLIGQAETMIGGRRQRVRIAFVVFFLAIMLVLAADKLSFRMTVRVGMLTTGVLLALGILAFPWSEWFPGTAVYREDASFLIRHAALFTFLGFIITLVSCVLGAVGLVRRSLKDQARAEAARVDGARGVEKPAQDATGSSRHESTQ